MYRALRSSPFEQELHFRTAPLNVINQEVRIRMRSGLRRVATNNWTDPYELDFSVRDERLQRHLDSIRHDMQQRLAEGADAGAKLAATLAAEIRESDATPILIVLPMHPEFRATMQPHIAALRSLLEKIAHQQSGIVIDALDVVSADDYADALHPNAAGREAYSRFLGRAGPPVRHFAEITFPHAIPNVRVPDPDAGRAGRHCVAAPGAGQHWMLLIASYVFYAWWDVRFLILLLLTSMIDYSAALGIYGVQLSWRERIRLSILLIAGAYLTLGLNWPAVQRGDVNLSVVEFLQPGWVQAPAAIAVIAAFAVIGPIGYSFYFRLSEKGRRNAFLATSMIANLVILGFFKYFNFFRDNMVGLGQMLGFDWAPPALEVALPVGISFYTFVTMSYGIDAYRGDIVPERSFLRMALFVSYFPHLVAGPIIRPEQLLPTLHEPWKLVPERLLSGFHLAAVGMVKKVIIADSIAPLVEVILGHPAGQPSLLVWLGTALFAVQIYCDFSGYTDVARGVSRMVGVELPLNFNFPYFSTSIIDFWRRWHISLSSWLRDYLYIPLGGGRVSLPRVYFNLLTTMVLGGLWHGASWNFVIWGTYQGVLLCINRFFSDYKATKPTLVALFEQPAMKVACWAVSMYFVLLGWLIFRVTSLHDLLYATCAFVLFDGNFDLTNLGLGVGTPVIALLAFAIFLVLHASSYFAIRWSELLDRLPSPALTAAYVLLGLLFFVAWPSHNAPFIYFQF